MERQNKPDKSMTENWERVYIYVFVCVCVCVCVWKFH